MLRRFVPAALSLALLGGCAVLPMPFAPSAPDGPAASAPTGGGVVGSIDPRMAALTSAGTKPLAGAAIATYTSQQEQELHTQLDDKGVSITRAGNQLVVDVPADLAFEPGKTAIKPEAKAMLTAIGIILKHFDRTIVDVYGYTDAQASPSADKDLSQKRAVAVATVLSSRGVDQGRFYIEGRGAADPVAANSTDAGRAQNRRIDIQISPIT